MPWYGIQKRISHGGVLKYHLQLSPPVGEQKNTVVLLQVYRKFPQQRPIQTGIIPLAFSRSLYDHHE